MADISKIQIGTGTYNVKDEQARNDISSINTEITSINNKLNNDRIICIGDSYGVGTTYGGTIDGWCDRLKTLRNISNENYYKFVEGQSGFTRAGLNGHTFQSLLEANINSISHPETITKVIVCGGHNEYDATGEALNSAISYFINYCKQHFVNAKIYVGMIGNNSNTTAFGKSVRTAIYTTILRSYQNCVLYGGIYLNGIQNIMHDYKDFMSEDGVHPNNTGYNFLTGYINNAINNGYADFKGNTHVDSIQAVNSIGSFQIKSKLTNDIQQFSFDDISITFTDAFNWNAGALMNIANTTPVNFKYHNQFLKIPVYYYVMTSSNQFYGGFGLLEFRDNQIVLRNVMLKNDGNAYFNIENVKSLSIQSSSVTTDNGIC